MFSVFASELLPLSNTLRRAELGAPSPSALTPPFSARHRHFFAIDDRILEPVQWLQPDEARPVARGWMAAVKLVVAVVRCVRVRCLALTRRLERSISRRRKKKTSRFMIAAAFPCIWLLSQDADDLTTESTKTPSVSFPLRLRRSVIDDCTPVEEKQWQLKYTTSHL